MTPEAPDEELMVRVGGGDVFAYTLLVERHLPAVYRGACRMLHDKHEAEDVAQESFTRLWRNAPRWQSSGAGLPAWLNRVAMNLCLDCLRRKGRWTTDELPDLPDPAIAADRLIEQDEVHEVLELCLESLSGNHRAAIVLTYYEGYSNRAAAEFLNMDLKAFESLLHRARRKLGLLLSMGGVAPHDLELFA
jgi:RNA polymerase sigma-70 factor (ECF subfamily)